MEAGEGGGVLDLGTDGRATHSPPTGTERCCSEDTGTEQPLALWRFTGYFRVRKALGKSGLREAGVSTRIARHRLT